MNNPGAEGMYKTVAVYELLGTAALTYAVIVSGGDMWAACFTLAIHVAVAAGVSGGHANGALTVGFFIYFKNFSRDFGMFITMMIAQFVGAMFGMYMASVTLLPTARDPIQEIPQSWVVYLCPRGYDSDGTVTYCDQTGSRHVSAFAFQFVATFIFIFSIIILGAESTKPSKKLILNIGLVILVLFGMIKAANNVGSACFNPSVALALHVWANWTVTDAGILAAVNSYAYIFYVASTLGGALAGFLGIFHANIHTELKNEAKRLKAIKKAN